MEASKMIWPPFLRALDLLVRLRNAVVFWPSLCALDGISPATIWT
jgi:hypothetical protein